MLVDTPDGFVLRAYTQKETAQCRPGAHPQGEAESGGFVQVNGERRLGVRAAVVDGPLGSKDAHSAAFLSQKSALTSGRMALRPDVIAMAFAIQEANEPPSSPGFIHREPTLKAALGSLFKPLITRRTGGDSLVRDAVFIRHFESLSERELSGDSGD
jgi:hypothetical protein